ncbi:hypothetical protein ACQEVC_10720 [Plantactinospora sp. CA-294935]|uniref:hypothetical protein n=1 Tax=Plantactinospora sp. CA-294935 TaxID=3240012 RepID=UPI003D92AB4C
MTDDRADAPTGLTPPPAIPASRDQPADPANPDPAADAGRGLVRMTFNLTPRGADALDSACARTKDTKTDTINRALVVYNVVLGLIDRGGGQLSFQRQDGNFETVHLL